MQGLRKFGLVLCVLLFTPLLLGAVSSYAFNQTLGKQAYVQQTLREARVYASISNAVVVAAQGPETEESVITEALRQTFSAEEIEKVLDPVIVSMYDWLEGEVKQPDFSVSFLEARTSFETTLKQKLEERAASLPACTSAAQLTVTDIATAECIPPGTDVHALIDDAVARVVNTADVFSDEAVSDGRVEAEEVEDLNIQAPQTEELPTWPGQAYRFTKNGVWFFAAGALLTGVGVVFLSSRKLGGARKLSVLLLINGLVLVIVGYGSQTLTGRFVPTASVDRTEEPVKALQVAARIITDDTAQISRNFGLALAVVGLIGIITATVLLNRNKKEPGQPVAPTSAKPPTTVTPAQ